MKKSQPSSFKDVPGKIASVKDNTQSPTLDVLKQLKTEHLRPELTIQPKTDLQIRSNQRSASSFNVLEHPDTPARSNREVGKTTPGPTEYSLDDLYAKTKHVISATIHSLDKHLYPPFWANEGEKIMQAQFAQISPEGRAQLQKYAFIIDIVKEFDPNPRREKAALLNSYQKNLFNELRLSRNGHIRMAIEEYSSWKNYRINHYLRYEADHHRTERNSTLKTVPGYTETIRALSKDSEALTETKRLARNIGKIFKDPHAQHAVLPETMILQKDILVAKLLPFLSKFKDTTELNRQHEGVWWVDDAYNSTSIYLDHHYGPAFTTSSDNSTRPKTATVFIKADQDTPGFFAKGHSENPTEGEVLLPAESHIQLKKIYDFDLSTLPELDRRILRMPDYIVLATYQKAPETTEA